MVGRRAIEHPWVFREIRSRLDKGVDHPPPTLEERLELCRKHLGENVRQRGELHGVRVTRRHLSGYLRGMPGAAELRRTLLFCESYEGCLAILDGYQAAQAKAA